MHKIDIDRPRRQMVDVAAGEGDDIRDERVLRFEDAVLLQRDRRPRMPPEGLQPLGDELVPFSRSASHSSQLDQSAALTGE
jgi:hypothetical protein